MIYQCQHFKIEELVPKDIFEAHNHEQHKLWLLFDQRVLITLDRLRSRYGKLVANDWLWGGRNQYRGWRPWALSTGAPFSQHKFGRAADSKPIEVTAEEIRQDLRSMDKAGLPPYGTVLEFIKCIEVDVPWLHFDTRNWCDSLLEVKP